MARSLPARAVKDVDRPTIRSRPCTGKPTTAARGCAMGPMTAARTTSRALLLLTFSQIRRGSYVCPSPLIFPVKFSVLKQSGFPGEL